MSLLKSVLLILIWGRFLSDASRILGIFPCNVKSHSIMFERLMIGLAKRGHQVDVASVYPLKQPVPNYNDIITFPHPTIGNPTNNLTLQELEQVTVLEFIAINAGNDLCELLGSPQIQQLVRNPPDDPPYDLLITEIFGAHCFMAIGYLLKIPVIGVTSTELYPWMNDMIANPENVAWVPNTLLKNVDQSILLSSFWWRLYNALCTFQMKMRFNCLTQSQDDIIRKYYGTEMPGVRELESKLALVLANYHVSLSNVQPITPALIQVGGLHIRDEDNTPMPRDLEKWLDEAENGFVYLALGSMIKIESFPRDTLDALYRSLGKITPVRVLMKITDPKELPPNIPENIYALPWLPQTQVLKHPNIKAFMTHGGNLGTQEAVYFGVPIIGLPLFADQYKNINNYVRLNVALRLDIWNFNEESIDDALHEILHNPKYTTSVKRLSKIFRDRPESPLDTAIYWVEYVIKYGDESLRSPAIELSWWQIALLDVYGFLAVCILILLYTVKRIITKISYYTMCRYNLHENYKED